MLTNDSILKDFKEKYISIQDLSKKYKLDALIIKSILRENMGAAYNSHIKKIAGHYGGKAFSQKLSSDTNFRTEYKKKMSDSVSKSINIKMQNRSYKTKWIKKAKSASLLGHDKVRELLNTNSKFRERWIKNCKLGGKITFNESRGAFNPKNKLKRMLGSIKGLSRTTRKVTGPKGENMYNSHEVKVAECLIKNNCDYIYEKRFFIDSPNGYFSCDFIIPLQKQVIIEATYWDEVLEKCNRFKRKYNYLKTLLGNTFYFIIVVNTQTLKDKYLRYLPDKKIITISELDTYLNKISSGERI